jgi:hypothetical protein
LKPDCLLQKAYAAFGLREAVIDSALLISRTGNRGLQINTEMDLPMFILTDGNPV